jgi:hypothetical protein
VHVVAGRRGASLLQLQRRSESLGERLSVLPDLQLLARRFDGEVAVHLD